MEYQTAVGLNLNIKFKKKIVETNFLHNTFFFGGGVVGSRKYWEDASNQSPNGHREN
jgi:hypothetical protein